MKRLKGLFTDCEPIDQPEGTYRDALNIQLDESLGAVVSEKHRSIISSELTSHIIIGTLSLENGDVLIFTKVLPNYRIYRLSNDTVVDIFSTDDVNFFGNYVQGTYTKNVKGETLVYFVDGLNPPRFFNYNSSPIVVNNLFPEIASAPIANLDISNFGGSLLSGSYYFAFAYIDEDGNETNYMNVTNPININRVTNSITVTEGSEPQTITSKSINLSISNIDTSYSKLRIIVIIKFDDVFDEVRQLSDLVINGATINVTYTGTNSFTLGSLEQVIVDNASYSSVGTVALNDGFLYLGNLKSTPDLGYQPWANGIEVEAVTKQELGSFNQSYYADDTFVVKNKSFKRDEVYAFYLAFVLKNGGLSKAYHIPGRKPIAEIPVNAGSLGTGTIEVTKSASSITTINHGFTLLTQGLSKGNESYKIQIRVTTTNGTFEKIFNVSILEGDSAIEIKNKIKATIDASADGFWFASISGSIIDVTFTGNIDDEGMFNLDVSILDMFTIDGRNPDDLKSLLESTYITLPVVGENNNSLLGNYIVNFGLFQISTPLRRNLTDLNIAVDIKTKLNAATALIVSTDTGSIVDMVTTEFTSQFNDFPIIEYQPILPTVVSSFSNIISTGIVDGQDIIPVAIPSPELDDIGDFKKYQIESEPDSVTGMGYWENQNELYPNTSDFDGSVHGEDIASTKVRHHKFPSHEYKPIHTATGFVGFGNIEILGIKLKNVIIPNDIKDQVVGYKVFYASRNSQKTIIDSFHAIPLLNKTIFSPEYIVAPHSGGTDYGSGLEPDKKGFALYSFSSLKDRISIGSAAHIKPVYRLSNSILSIGGQNDGVTVRNNNSSLIPISLDINAINQRIQYIDSSIKDTKIDLNSSGFTTYTSLSQRVSESKVVTQLETALEDYQYVFNLLKIPNDIYLSFEQQLLVDTGYYKQIDVSTVSDDIYGGDTFIVPFNHKAMMDLGTTDKRYVCIHRLFIESSDNPTKIASGTEIWQKPYSATTAIKYAAPRVNSAGEFKFDNLNNANADRIVNADNWFGYSKDNSSVNNIKPAFPLFDETEPEQFPTRIARSKQENISTVSQLRIFLPNDHIDLATNRGKLVKLAIYNNTLIPHMERALVRTKGKEELAINDFRAFVGTGDIFSVKPDEIIYTEKGFGGIQDITHSISTDFGYFFVDRQAKKIYGLTNDGISEISNSGLRKNFEFAISPSLDTKCIWGYDYQNRKLFLTLMGTGVSQTLTYSPQRQAWISFHDYFPDYYISTFDNLYSLENNKLIKHNVNAGSVELGDLNTRFKFIDNISPTISKIVDSITIIGEVKNINDVYVNDFLTSLSLENTRQNSGLVTIDTTNNFQYIGNARKTKNEWNINKFRDTSGVPSGDYAWAYRKRFDDKFVIVTLNWTKIPSNQNLLYLYDAKVNFKPSIR